MRSNKSILLLTLVLIARTSQANYEAHEWGTFTSVVDSTGVTQNGLYHEDEALPDFVHGFGELRRELAVAPPEPTPVPIPPRRPPCHSKICFGLDELQQNNITQKMETPVIYFYADQDQAVKVDVKFPQGVITETYPGPVATFPTMQDPHIIANGSTQFAVNILAQKTGNIPFVAADNIYAHARLVNSNLLTSGAETEKFIFYRGLGHFQPKISITSKDGNLTIGNLATARPQSAFLIHVDENGDGQLLSLDAVKSKDSVFVSSRRIALIMNHTLPSPAVTKGEQAKGKLIDELMASGLFKDEALAMVNTWEHGYLKVPGLRLLYILPRNEVDAVLPLAMTPAPDKLVRSFVGRMEILLDTDEQRILSDIKTQQDRFQAMKLGRFAEPILHRVRELAAKTEVENSTLLNLIDNLIKDVAVKFSATGTVH